MSYSFEEHLHRYSVWTAARAAQRGFTNTPNIQVAIEKSKLRDIKRFNIETAEQFDNFHKTTASLIMESLQNKCEGANPSYGRAAKIIAIYLKTSVIIREPESLLAKIIHPPIDRILLHGVSKKFGILEFMNTNWTELDQNKYFNLIDTLRKLEFKYFWELEENWTII